MNHVIASVSEAILFFIRDCHVILKAFRIPRNDRKERISLPKGSAKPYFPSQISCIISAYYQ